MYKLVAVHSTKNFSIYFKHGAGFTAMDWAASKVDEDSLCKWLKVFAETVCNLDGEFEIDLILVK